MSRALGPILLAIALAFSSAACTTPACVPDGQPACECSPGDSRLCTSDAGMSGLEVCGNDGRWTACAEFGDAEIRDNGHADVPAYDFGVRE